MTWLIAMAAGLVLGAALIWFFLRRQQQDSIEFMRQQMNDSGNRSLTVLQDELNSKNSEIRTLRGLYDTERVAHAEAKSGLDEARRRLDEQQQFVEKVQLQMADKFASLSQDALTKNNAAFLDRARSELEKLLETAKGDIGQKQQAIDSLLRPVADTLKRYEDQIKALESSRQQAYGNIEAQLKQVAQSTQQLQKDTFSLGQALRTPQIKGRWGELTLRRIVELAGMTEHVDFVEQVSVDTEDGRLRPDMIVHIAGGGLMVVDSKVPLNAYLDAIEAQTEDERKTHLLHHAQLMKNHVRGLSGKAYWNQFERAPDCVVMFVSGESFFSAALECDRSLMEDAWSNKVILASPSSLMAILGSVARSWRMEQFAQNAEDIRRLGSDLYDRVAVFVENFSGVGRSLEKAVESYDRAVGSLERRVLVSARKFRELGATAQAEIAEVEPVERAPRKVQTDLLVPVNNGWEGEAPAEPLR